MAKENFKFLRKFQGAHQLRAVELMMPSIKVYKFYQKINFIKRLFISLKNQYSSESIRDTAKITIISADYPLRYFKKNAVHVFRRRHLCDLNKES